MLEYSLLEYENTSIMSLRLYPSVAVTQNHMYAATYKGMYGKTARRSVALEILKLIEAVET